MLPAGGSSRAWPIEGQGLLGLARVPEEVVRRVAAHAKRPIIMPLSNPTSRSEARPQDLADWTEGRPQ